MVAEACLTRHWVQNGSRESFRSCTASAEAPQDLYVTITRFHLFSPDHDASSWQTSTMRSIWARDSLMGRSERVQSNMSLAACCNSSWSLVIDLGLRGSLCLVHDVGRRRGSWSSIKRLLLSCASKGGGGDGGAMDWFVELEDVEGSRLRFLPHGGVVSYLVGIMHAYVLACSRKQRLSSEVVRACSCC